MQQEMMPRSHTAQLQTTRTTKLNNEIYIINNNHYHYFTISVIHENGKYFWDLLEILTNKN